MAQSLREVAGEVGVAFMKFVNFLQYFAAQQSGLFEKVEMVWEENFLLREDFQSLSAALHTMRDQCSCSEPLGGIHIGVQHSEYSFHFQAIPVYCCHVIP